MLAADKAPGDEGLAWRFEGQVQEISLHHPDLDRQSWRDVRLEAASQGRFFPRQSRWQIDAGRFGFPGLPVAVMGFVQGGEAPSGSLSFQVSDWPCSDLVGHAPGSLRGALWGLALEGRLAAAMDVTFDAADWEKLALDVRFPSLCHVTRDPEPLAADLSPLQTGAAPVSTRSDLPLSPRQPGFTPLQSIPPHVRAAFLTAEDAGFFLHHGFEPEHMRRALVHNLERGRLARGASTITQQVAKNLFLSHERTLARKLAEAVLTWRLDALVPKPRMLELYLNLVELGPGIHGVGEAARVYFGKAPEALTPLEAAHLASLPPNPRGFARRFRDGSVDEGWLARLYDLVGIMGRRGHLSPADVAAARGAKLQLRKI
ncbi:MAG: transglycosylase domain-containing protein [Myxococcales bacterium]|nr:transglycosylase domain-containing protein [Myxococcales bacterium]